jgi:hypothetical protein
MKNIILITFTATIFFSCTSSNDDIDELRQEVEQLKIDNENLVDEVEQKNSDQDLNSNNYSEDSKQPISPLEEEQVVTSKIQTTKNGKRMSPKEFGKALGAKGDALIKANQDKNEYSRLTWGGN